MPVLELLIFLALRSYFKDKIGSFNNGSESNQMHSDFYDVSQAHPPHPGFVQAGGEFDQTQQLPANSFQTLFQDERGKLNPDEQQGPNTESLQNQTSPLIFKSFNEKQGKKKKKKAFNYDEPVDDEELMPYDAVKLLKIDSNTLNTPNNVGTPAAHTSYAANLSYSSFLYIFNKSQTSSVLLMPPPVIAKINFQSSSVVDYSNQPSARSKRDNESTISQLQQAITTLENPQHKKRRAKQRHDDDDSFEHIAKMYRISFIADPYGDLDNDFTLSNVPSKFGDKKRKGKNKTAGGDGDRSNTISNFGAATEINIGQLNQHLGAGGSTSNKLIEEGDLKAKNRTFRTKKGKKKTKQRAAVQQQNMMLDEFAGEENQQYLLAQKEARGQVERQSVNQQQEQYEQYDDEKNAHMPIFL